MDELEAYDLGGTAAARGEPKRPPADLTGDLPVAWIMGYEGVERHPEVAQFYLVAGPHFPAGAAAVCPIG